MDKLNINHLKIKSWSQADRPREKLIHHGKNMLSDAELKAKLIGSGTKDQTSLDLAKKILFDCNNSLDQLGKAGISHLKKTPGIGDAKAVTIIAALELGRRRNNATPASTPIIVSSESAYKLLVNDLEDLDYEEFWILMLNSGNRLINKKRISIGGINKTVVDARVIFKLALEAKASALILGHNHPSGTLKPSQADLGLTQKLVQAGKLLDIKVLDHLIVSNSGYLSFSDSGLMNSD